MQQRKIERYISEMIGKRVTSYLVEIGPGNQIGRFRSLDVARRVRDNYLTEHGEPSRHRRPMGTGAIRRSGKRFCALYATQRLGKRDTIEECEALLREYIASLPLQTWHSGRHQTATRTLPKNAP